MFNLHFLTYKPNFVVNFIACVMNDQRGKKIWGICVQLCENVKVQQEDIYFRAQIVHFNLQIGTLKCVKRWLKWPEYLLWWLNNLIQLSFQKNGAYLSFGCQYCWFFGQRHFNLLNLTFAVQNV